MPYNTDDAVPPARFGSNSGVLRREEQPSVPLVPLSSRSVPYHTIPYYTTLRRSLTLTEDYVYSTFHLG